MGSFTLIAGGKAHKVPYNEGETVFSAVSRCFSLQSPCGGNGICGKCRATLTSADGTIKSVLCCRTAAQPGVIEPAAAGFVCTALPEFSASAASSGDLRAAVDIGTTTVEVCLIGSSGKTISRATALNAQSVFGADILSRIKYATASVSAARKIRDVTVTQIESLLSALSGTSGISAMTVVGNPAMVYFLAGIDSRSLGFAPFTPTRKEPLELDSASLGFRDSFRIYIPGCAAAYIGSDITAGLMYSGAAGKPGTSVYLDLGTNGEMVLCHKGRLICCSVAAGPAFEGASMEFGTGAVPGAVSVIRKDLSLETIRSAEPCGICGSGLLDAAAVMLENGIMDATGRMDASLVSSYNGQPALDLYKGKIFFTQKDVRELQLAKAAVQAGILTMADYAGIEVQAIDTLYLAGSFGSHINLSSCSRIGLLAGIPEGRTVLLGNAAALGCTAIAESQEARRRTEEIRQRLEYMELFRSDVFRDFYTDSMFFGEGL